MDRRFLTVLGVSLLFALVVSGIFYQMSAKGSRGPGKPDGLQMKEVVVAARALQVGVSLKPDDLKVVRLPEAAVPKTGFTKVEDVLERPVISNILMDEPILEGRLAQRGSGLGLAPVIPVGMRAISVRVNEVVGVAGFVLPGMHVDVLITGRPPDREQQTVTTTVLQNITVLSAGQALQPEASGQAMNAPVVTVLVTPEQAEILTLAGNESKIHLVLRNSTDDLIADPPGRHIQELYRRTGVKPMAPAEPAPRRPAPERVVVVQAPPPPPPADEVVVFRGTKKSVEAVANAAGTR